MAIGTKARHAAIAIPRAIPRPGGSFADPVAMGYRARYNKNMANTGPDAVPSAGLENENNRGSWEGSWPESSSGFGID